MITLKQAKRDFELGYLNKYRIERSPLNDGWVLILGERKAAGALVDARNKEPKVYKSLDSVISALEDIGFAVNVLA